MASPAIAAAVLSSTVLASSLLTAGWIRLALARRIEDLPGQRRLHSQATPRGGGIAIALVMLAALACLVWAGQGGDTLIGLAAGILLFAGAGLLDDLYPVPVLGKFGLQLLAATVMVVTLAGASMATPWLVLLVVACAYAVNLWNFMDGSNGMIAVQSGLVALALAAWPGQPESLQLAALALAGACAGFLPFNLPKARVFLGDVGSHALGAAVFGLLLLSWLAGTLAPAQCLLLCLVLLVDGALTLSRRALAGRKVWRAHREHLYQIAIRRGHSHGRVCLYYALATCVGIAMAAVAGEFRSTLVMWGFLIFSLGFTTVIYFMLRQHWLKPARRRGSEA